jgi:hypothetical protein
MVEALNHRPVRVDPNQRKINEPGTLKRLFRGQKSRDPGQDASPNFVVK